MGLGLDLGIVDEDPAVGGQASKGGVDVGVDLVDLSDRSGILELERGFTLDGEDDGGAADDGERTRAALDGLAGVVDLMELAGGREDRQG